jgi:hypothetical protein
MKPAAFRNLIVRNSGDINNWGDSESAQLVEAFTVNMKFSKNVRAQFAAGGAKCARLRFARGFGCAVSLL